ncbi:MAG TPA: LuxR C-terminal-related transcriptional regulator [Pseudomonadales bacterium]|nr:LuxR C-terminal-related transcriptional regulator [Pseudomonadales bacterium]
MNEKQYQKALDLVYQAPFIESGWISALENVVELTGGCNCAFQIFEEQAGYASPIVTILARWDDQMMQRYDEVVGEHGDPRGRFALQHPGDGRILHDADYTSEAEMRRDPYFQDVLIPFDHKYATMFVAKWWDDVDIRTGYGFALQRSPSQGPLTGEGLEILEALRPHMIRAARLGEMIEASTIDTLSVTGLLQDHPFPTFIINRKLGVVTHNDAARQLMQSHHDVDIHAGQISGRLAELVRERLGFQAGDKPSDTVELSSGRFKLEIFPFISPLREGTGRLLVVMLKPITIPRRGPELLINKFHLTRSEATIAHALATRHSVSSYAEESGISVHTARSQIKSAMSKMGVRSQVELVRKILSSNTAQDI